MKKTGNYYLGKTGIILMALTMSSDEIDKSISEDYK